MNGIPLVNVEMAPTTAVAQVAIVSSPAITSTTNLRVGTATTATTTTSTGAATPLTPEILNSVMAMTNPLEYSFPSSANALMTTKVSQVNEWMHQVFAVYFQLVISFCTSLSSNDSELSVVLKHIKFPQNKSCSDLSNSRDVYDCDLCRILIVCCFFYFHTFKSFIRLVRTLKQQCTLHSRV